MKVFGVIKQIWKIMGLVFGLLFFFGLPIYFAYDETVNAPQAALMQQQLEQEFKTIKPLPQAIACDFHASHKTHHSLVGSSYSTNLSFQEIRAFYDAELSKQGWRFHKEVKNYDWFQDLGGKSIEYCKGNLEASLEYAGENANNGWEYALELSWGLESLNDKWKGDVCK